MHFAFGLAAGTAWMAVDAIRSSLSVAPCARRMAVSLLRAYGFGILAVFPNLLRHIGFPNGLCSGWWMNVFFLNPLIDHLKRGGLLFGEIGILACWVVRYTLLLILIATHRTPSSIPPSRS